MHRHPPGLQEPDCAAMSDLERLARLEAWRDSHEDRCKERYEANASALERIEAAATALTSKIDGAFARVHERIDGADERIGGHKVWILSSAIVLLLAILGYAVTTWGPLAK